MKERAKKCTYQQTVISLRLSKNLFNQEFAFSRITVFQTFFNNVGCVFMLTQLYNFPSQLVNNLTSFAWLSPLQNMLQVYIQFKYCNNWGEDEICSH